MVAAPDGLPRGAGRRPAGARGEHAAATATGSLEETPAVLVHITLRLPRTPVTVAAARRVLDNAMRAIGVTDDCRYELSLALTEACANAVEHAREGADYCITITADRRRCTVDIIDSGVGMRKVDPVPVAATAPRGRGMAIIRACVDSLSVDPVLPEGVAVRFTKRLSLAPEYAAGTAGGTAPPVRR